MPPSNPEGAQARKLQDTAGRFPSHRPALTQDLARSPIFCPTVDQRLSIHLPGASQVHIAHLVAFAPGDHTIAIRQDALLCGIRPFPSPTSLMASMPGPHCRPHLTYPCRPCASLRAAGKCLAAFCRALASLACAKVKTR